MPDVRPGDLAETAGYRRIVGRGQQLSDALVASGELVLVDRGDTLRRNVVASPFHKKLAFIAVILYCIGRLAADRFAKRWTGLLP